LQPDKEERNAIRELAGLAWLAFKRDLRLIGTAFSFFAAAEQAL